MAKVRTLLAATMLVAVSANAVSAADACMQNREIKADQIRFVETQMRIATLQCRGGAHRDIISLYNDFVRSKRPYFIEAEGPLREFLKRSKKGGLDGYVVAVANRVSLGSSSVAQFCDRAQMALQMAVKMPDPSGLVTLMPVRYRQPERSCTFADRSSIYQ